MAGTRPAMTRRRKASWQRHIQSLIAKFTTYLYQASQKLTYGRTPTAPLVMAGLVPAIHAFAAEVTEKAWMAGTRPAMTKGRPATTEGQNSRTLGINRSANADGDERCQRS